MTGAACPGIDRRALISGMTAASALGGVLSTAVQAQTAALNGGFSFAACGDSRPMMYLPSKDGRPDLVELFVEMFGLVMPEKVAEEVVKRDVKMIFDPVTKELIQIVMPFMSKTEVMTLTVDKGWVTRASVEDVKLLPGVHRDNVPAPGRRLGCARDRAARAGRARQIRCQQRRRRLVGQPGPHCQ